MFLGEFEHAVDDKGRVIIPVKFRKQLSEGLIVTKGIDPCLWLFPGDGWEQMAARISELPRTDPKVREFRRQHFGSASDAPLDKQGRVILPTYLREYAKIDHQAVIVGLYDYCEIWNPERWRERQEESDRDPEARAEQFANLGI